MREEIRLGNEALAKGAIVDAIRHYRSLLEKGGTEIEERIARNRLSEIAYEEKKQQQQQEKEEKKSRVPSRSGGGRKAQVKIKEEKEEAGVRKSTRLIYKSGPPLVDIKKF